MKATFKFTIKDCYTASFSIDKAAAKNFNNVKWLFGDGTSSVKTASQHIYKKPGTYKVKAITTSKTGCNDTVTRDITIAALKTDFTITETGETGTVSFKAKNNSANHKWQLDDGSSNQFVSAFTHQYKESGTYTATLVSKNNTGCIDSITKLLTIKLPEGIKDNEVVVDMPAPKDQAAESNFFKRERDVIKNILVENENITVSLYDNGLIDGDSVTLIYNNKIIVANQLLNSHAIGFQLKIESGNNSNELTMYAENLGSIPPNTALLIINDGENRHVLNVTSNKTSNGVITFTLKPKGNH